jgi:hypothetical protein
MLFGHDRVPWVAEGIRRGFSGIQRRFVLQRRDPHTGEWSSIGAPTSLNEALARMDEELAWRREAAELRVRPERRTWLLPALGVLLLVVAAIVLVVVVM